MPEESVDKMRKRGLDVSYGGFAENITVKGIALLWLGAGAGLHIGESAFFGISRIGKECRARCSIYYRV